MPPILNAIDCLQLMRKPTVNKGYTMIKFYTNLVIKRGDSYVAWHEYIPDVYVLTPHRERAIHFNSFDAVMSFLRSMECRDIDIFQIVPVKN